MATRIFCDHCGNTVREPLVYSYGPFDEINRRHEAAVAQMRLHLQMQQNSLHAAGASANHGGGGNGGSGPVQAPQSQGPTPPRLEMVNVDLCLNCAPIWMERVRALTQRSDPEEKSNV